MLALNRLFPDERGILSGLQAIDLEICIQFERWAESEDHDPTRACRTARRLHTGDVRPSRRSSEPGIWTPW